MTPEIPRHQVPPREKSRMAIIAAVCAMGVAMNVYIGVSNRVAWGVDYNQFYAASRLAGTGHLYDWDALRKIELETGLIGPTGRLPVVLYGYKTLSRLPYAVARYIWMAVSIAALTVFAAWPGARRLPMLGAMA